MLKMHGVLIACERFESGCLDSWYQPFIGTLQRCLIRCKIWYSAWSGARAAAMVSLQSSAETRAVLRAVITTLPRMPRSRTQTLH